MECQGQGQWGGHGRSAARRIKRATWISVLQRCWCNVLSEHTGHSVLTLVPTQLTGQQGKEPAQPHVPFVSAAVDSVGGWLWSVQAGEIFHLHSLLPFFFSLSAEVKPHLALWLSSLSLFSPAMIRKLHHTPEEVVICTGRGRRCREIVAEVCTCTHTHTLASSAFAHCITEFLHRQDVKTLVSWGKVLFLAFKPKLNVCEALQKHQGVWCLLWWHKAL